MSLVVDSSVLVAALVDFRDDGVWASSKISSGGLVGPENVLAETTNVLRRYELSGLLSRADASAALSEFLRYEIDLYPFASFATRVWELRTNLTSYDTWYVALAEELNCPLATLDLNLSRANGQTCEIVAPPAR